MSDVSELDRIANTIHAHRYYWDNEYELQDSIEKVLQSSGIAAVREHRLQSGDRLDFLAGRIAIEIKIKGTLTNVIRQLARYAKSDEIDGIVLVTAVARLTMIPAEILGKPVAVSSVLGDLL